MKYKMRLKNHSLLAKILFWSGQIIGTVSIILLLLFVAGNIIGELIEGLITVREEPLLVVLLFFLLGSLTGFIYAWFRSRTGAIISVASTIAAGLTWGFGDITLLLILLLPLFSGILILLSSYQKAGKPVE